MGPLAGRTQVNEVGAERRQASTARPKSCMAGSTLQVVGADAAAWRVLPDRAALRRPAVRADGAARYRGVRSGEHRHAVCDARRGRGARQSRARVPGRVTVHGRCPTWRGRWCSGTAPYHGRLMIVDRTSAKESTGHGSPLAAPRARWAWPRRRRRRNGWRARRAPLHAAHGAAGLTDGARGDHAGVDPQGGRSAAIASIRSGSTSTSSRSARRCTRTGGRSPRATSSNFAGISGDFFYAHMDDVAAKDSIFERRVAHGYFVLSAAAGLFVDPAPGPGARELRPRESAVRQAGLHRRHDPVRLTCKQKTAKEDREGQIPQGVVAWDVEVTNQTRRARGGLHDPDARSPARRCGRGRRPTAELERACRARRPMRWLRHRVMQQTQPGDAPARVARLTGRQRDDGVRRLPSGPVGAGL